MVFEDMIVLHTSGIWEMVQSPPGNTTIGCRSVYTIKVGLDGNVDQFKACLMEKGYTQITLVNLFLAEFVICDWPFKQLDY